MMNNQRKNQKTAENPRKSRLFNRKTVETAPAFVQNKPKVKSPRIRLTAVLASIYAQMDNWLNAKNKPNQTQFKPNAERAHKLLHYRTLHNQTVTPRAKNKPDSNPTPETNTSPYKAKTYTEKKPRGTDKNKPKQTRFQISWSFVTRPWPLPHLLLSLQSAKMAQKPIPRNHRNVTQ
jgi:hypothetical protein